MDDSGINKPAREAVVLDAEGHVLHDPVGEKTGPNGYSGFKVMHVGRGGLISTLLFGFGFLILLVLGLTFAGVALAGFLFVLIARMIFSAKKR